MKALVSQLPRKEVPTLVPIVLRTLAKLRARGGMSARSYSLKLKRLCQEELHPRGMILLESPLPEGGVRYEVQDETGGHVRETIELGTVAG